MLRDAQRQHAILQGGLDLVGIDRNRQRDFAMILSGPQFAIVIGRVLDLVLGHLGVDDQATVVEVLDLH